MSDKNEPDSPTRLDVLLHTLLKLAESDDVEMAHIYADEALLQYINDTEVTKAFRRIHKWYA